MLRLHETGRFDGRYEGYLKLTDENGGGLDDDGWGLTVGSASGQTTQVQQSSASKVDRS